MPFRVFADLLSKCATFGHSVARLPKPLQGPFRAKMVTLTNPGFTRVYPGLVFLLRRALQGHQNLGGAAAQRNHL